MQRNTSGKYQSEAGGSEPPSASRRKRLASRRRVNPSVGMEAIVILFLCAVSLLMAGSLWWQLTTDGKGTSNSNLPLMDVYPDSPQSGNISPIRGLKNLATVESSHEPRQFSPRLPFPLPIFSKIPNAKHLIEETQSGSHPTIAGITAILQTFLSALHDKNIELSSRRNSKQDIINAFFNLASVHIGPFEAAYRGKSIFPIREDGSIFMSLAAYREHLLYDTLKNAFDQALHPEKLFVGAVVQNCFGKVRPDGTVDSSGKPCRTGVEVVGKNANGTPMTKVSDRVPDINGIENFCSDEKYRKYCESGQIRVLYVHETEALGPAVARYFASKLWGGETFFVQTDSHLQFAVHWDDKYIKEAKTAKSYPKVVLSAYPPGFSEGNGNTVVESSGARLCSCETRSDDPNPIIRINTGSNYRGGEEFPAQIPFIAAGFFFARAEFLVDVPFDPYLPWCFMGEEIALSMRAWTAGWDIYAPRKNLIAHQYRPGRMGLPKFWGSVNRLHRISGFGNNKLSFTVIIRIMNLAGYPQAERAKVEREGNGLVFKDMEMYGLGKERSFEDYMKLAGISVGNDRLVCKRIKWCGQMTVL
mmetsp:Transcript_2576/g.5401  ORF Transcript_2576/g.5401 Transcript_2576/m.5401 type:complete len:587 (+) Transcript_2576:56-1816(+)